MPPYLAFASLDRKSVRFTMPLCTIRRVERLNARAGIYALSLSLHTGMKIVCHHHCRRLVFVLTCPMPGCPTYIPEAIGRSLLFTLARSSEGRTPTWTNEGGERVREDVLLRRAARKPH